MSTVIKGRWYPEMPPQLDGEDIDHYTDRLVGVHGEDQRPYDHRRNRQCSIGWHEECSDPAGERCKCPCHTGLLIDPDCTADKHGSCVGAPCECSCHESEAS